MLPISWFACVILPFCLLMPCAAQEEDGPPSAEEFARRVEESRKEALRLYPDLADPNSIFSRAARAYEDFSRRSQPGFIEKSWDHPLRVAESISGQLQAVSPLDPVFSEVVPDFTTNKGANYSQVRVTKIRRDGIEIVHKDGSAFIPGDDLTDAQREKYEPRWTTENFTPTNLIGKVNSAIQDRDRELALLDTLAAQKRAERLAKAKFDFEREAAQEGPGPGAAHAIIYYCDRFTLRLYELAYAAQGCGQQEAMDRIERELKEPVPEPYKTRLKEIEERTKENEVRFKEIRLLLRGKHCELLRDGRPILKGIPKDGQLDGCGFEILNPDHFRIINSRSEIGNVWTFKVDLKTGEATLLPEASKLGKKGEITFRVLK